MKIKIISLKKLDDKPEQGFIIVENQEELKEYQDKVLLEKNMYGSLFKKKFIEYSNKPWKRKIVKIEFKGRKIYRMFIGGNSKGIGLNELGLTLHSCYLLFFNDDDWKESEKLKINKGSKFMFYWNQPNHYIRVAFKLGFISVILGIIGFIGAILTGLSVFKII